MYGLHVTLYVYDTHNAMHRRYTVRVQRMQRNATDVYVAICMQRTQRMHRNATDTYVAICMQRTQRMQRNATDAYVAVCMQRTQRYVYAIHALTATSAYDALPTFGGQRKRRPRAAETLLQARVVDNGTVCTCVTHNGLRIRYTQR